MSRSTRRDFLKQSAFTGAGLWVVGSRVLADETSPNEKLNIAIIGVGGRGRGNIEGVSDENIVALCDIDDNYLGEAAEQFPKAKRYHDFREMLETQKDIDAVVVSTPDHTHAVATVMALNLGKHVYCEKPLTRTIHEARAVAQAAARAKVATQMGNQGHANRGSRRCVELLQSGAIGPIREVHSWTDRPIWPQGIDRPDESQEPPSHVKWDLWLGPSPKRPYVADTYHPFKWRGWWDFGTGALGDMACHVMDVAFWALDLRDPSSVAAEGEPRKPETGPNWAIIRYEFPERNGRPALTLTWYDGGKRPPSDLVEGKEVPDNGSIFIGEKGTLFVPDAYGAEFELLPEKDFEDFEMPERTLPRPPGHHREWIDACKNGTEAGSNFEYATALTEMVLLGNVAFQVGEPIEWDAPNMKARNCPDANQYITAEYRSGWSL